MSQVHQTPKLAQLTQPARPACAQARTGAHLRAQRASACAPSSCITIHLPALQPLSRYKRPSSQPNLLQYNPCIAIQCNPAKPASLLQYDKLYCNTVSLSQPSLSLQYSNCIAIPFSVLLVASVYCNTLYQLPAPFISQYNQILQYNLGSSPTDSAKKKKFQFFFFICSSHWKNYKNINIYFFSSFSITLKLIYKNLFYSIFFNFTICKTLENYFLHL